MFLLCLLFFFFASFSSAGCIQEYVFVELRGCGSSPACDSPVYSTNKYGLAPSSASCPSADELPSYSSAFSYRVLTSSDDYDYSCTYVQNVGCSACYAGSSSCASFGVSVTRCRYLNCQTQNEADSVTCVNDGYEWNGTSCNRPPAQDSISYGCVDYLELDKATGQAVTYHSVYKLNYTNQTQEEVEKAPMSCADVGYCDFGQTQCVGDMGGYYGKSSSSASPDFSSSSAKVECKQTGQYMNSCYFECSNGATGRCDAIDGNCNLVDRESCIWNFLSSSSAGGGSSPSSEIPSDSIGYNKDYSGLLGAILDSLHHNNEQNDASLNNQDGTNALLSNISSKLDQMNNKTSLIVGNTSNLGGGGKDYTSQIEGLGDSLSKFMGYDGDVPDTNGGNIDTSGFILSFIKWFGDDSLASNLSGMLSDSNFYGANGDFGKNADSVQAKADEIGGYVKGLLDSGSIRDYMDTLAGWSGQFNFDRLGGGSTSCPSFLRQSHSVQIGTNSVEFGGLGIYLCAPVIGDKTPWDIGRLALRMLVVITCFLWLFRVCTQSAGGNDDE